VFDEFDDRGRGIRFEIERFLVGLEVDLNISFKDPIHDIARRFLNEIVEFNPILEEKEVPPGD